MYIPMIFVAVLVVFLGGLIGLLVFALARNERLLQSLVPEVPRGWHPVAVKRYNRADGVYVVESDGFWRVVDPSRKPTVNKEVELHNAWKACEVADRSFVYETRRANRTAIEKENS